MLHIIQMETLRSDGEFGLDNSSARKKYIIEYTVKDAIKKANDCAELYWQFIGADFEIPINNITGRIYLPDEVEKKEDIRVWGHTQYLNGTIYAVNNEEIKFNGEDLPSNTFFEVRVLFPTELIEYSGRIENGNILELVVEEETNWANEANAKRIFVKIIFLILLIGIDIFLIGLILKHYKYFKQMPSKYIPEEEMVYFREIPNDDRTPAEAYKLLNKIIAENFSSANIGNIFSANLLNLNLKKAIEIIPDINDKKEFTIKLIRDINIEKSKEEEIVYNFLKDASKNYELKLKDLKIYIGNHSNKVQELIEDINQTACDNFRTQKLIIEENRKRIFKEIGITSAILIFATTLLMMLTAVIMEIIRDNMLIGMTIISGIFIIIDIILLVLIYKKENIFTQKAVNESEKWKALKKFMEDFSMLDKREVPEVVLWEKYLVFATVFGVADKVIKQLKIVYPNIDNEISLNAHLNMYLLMNCNFNSSFSSSISTAMTSSLSSGSGAGGGFSGRRWRRPVAGGGGGGR